MKEIFINLIWPMAIYGYVLCLCATALIIMGVPAKRVREFIAEVFE